MRLHAEVQAQAYQPSNPLEGPSGKPSGNLAAMETSYVVRSHAAAQTHQELPCWTFSHYSSEETSSLTNTEIFEKSAELTFSDETASGVGCRCGYQNLDEKVTNLTTNTAIDAYILHGFLGTFHCVLYESLKKEEVVISIAPKTFSTGMYSWFPLFFPLREPLLVPCGSLLKSYIWRKTDTKSVWYEWYAEVIDKNTGNVTNSSNLHNPKGRSSKILL